MREFEEFLVQAAAQIAPEYFLLPIRDADARYRERVYCYELYHQLRSQWPPDCPYFLNGEVDKGGHPYVQQNRAAPKPDFIVHVPGTDNNYAVMEVKSPVVDLAGIRVDIRKMLQFRVFGYQRLLYLFYGMSAHEAIRKIEDAGTTAEDMAAIEIWVHSYPGRTAERAQ